MGRWPRRRFLGLCGAVATLPLLPKQSFAQPVAGKALHGLSAFGDLKYAADFTHFDYASPEAPKGGTFNFPPPNWAYNQNVSTFNTLNTFVRASDAPPRMEMCFDQLMVRALDEPDALYGLIAESVTISDDRNTYEFKLRPEAKFSDGSPLTAEDVAYTYRLFKEKGHPSLLLPLREAVDFIAVDDDVFRLVFSGKQSDRTILGLAEYPIVSKAFFETNPFDGSQLNPPLGSGPYKVGRFGAGQYIEYARRDDYWARDLPVNRGLHHFDIIRIEFYRERQAGFEAFKKGRIVYREEFTSKTWATEYDFPAIREGKVVKRTFPAEQQPSLQAWALNQRRERFRDPRVRFAIGNCFDFEWTQRNLFYGSYDRSQSLFEKSAFRASGTPSPEEMAILEKFRGQIPDTAFGEAVTQPVSSGSGQDRKLLRKALDLLKEAGWTRRGNFLANGKGERLTVELLVNDPVFVRVETPFIDNMRAIGIDASIRLVDSAQYQLRQADFDFDMISMAASFTASPTREELQHYFSSVAAAAQGSRNLPGMASPAIDALIDLAGKVKSRAELTTVMRVLDRVLRARQDWIPNWYLANHRVAYWDMFGFKEKKPSYGFPVEALWWVDEEKAKTIGKG
ncbi:MAG: extracellular solute-binding protein [Hyphomicrobiales bacterium]|nr:extracellular solute-binding protein [Hyphomicrobiales bacterium]